MIEVFVIGFLGLFYADNHDFIHKVKRDMDRGYKWEYVGYTDWDEDKAPCLCIKDSEGNNPHVYWILKKPKNNKQEKVMSKGCSNKLCENPLCSCENLEAGIMCECSEDNPCFCCIGTPD